MPKDISRPECGGKITKYNSDEVTPKITILRPHRGDQPEVAEQIDKDIAEHMGGDLDPTPPSSGTPPDSIQ